MKTFEIQGPPRVRTVLDLTVATINTPTQTITLTVGKQSLTVDVATKGAYAVAKEIADGLGLVAVVGLGSGIYRWETRS